MLTTGDKVAALQRTILFGELERHDREVLADRCAEHKLDRGETLFLAGEQAAGLYVVAQGAIRAYRVGADGREQIIHVERAGATLAEIPVFDGGSYPSSTAAEEDSVLLFIRREDVLRLCLERPHISLAALRLLAARMRKCAALVERLSLLHVDRRVAQLLLEEASEHGIRSGDAVEFQLALTHQQIAARVGSVREVVSRAITRLQQGGLIQVDGRKVVISSEQALRDYASE
ncbi:MAG TPA: Crp/Fnr family transcriptional regulator [Bryobacteraceae bacterium]|nr:Crp/Fnr family transcriptional regulator [Bryobacteraceae bacterium]